MRDATIEELESVENYIETCSVKMIPVSVLEDIKAEIEHIIPCGKEALSVKLGVLEIIDKYIKGD